MLSDIVKKIDVLAERYGKDAASQKAVKNDLLDLVQSAVEFGEAKDQGKIVGIASKLIKGFFSKGD